MSEESSSAKPPSPAAPESAAAQMTPTAQAAQAAQSMLPQAAISPGWQWSPWVIWLIPVLAAAIAGFLVVQAMLERGTDIVISFKSAEGLEAGKTRIKYKDVDIGGVKSISLSPDRSQVLVKAQLTKGAAAFARDDSVFWVVRPRIGTGGISGLSTLLSGAYIGVDVGNSEIVRSEFIGLDAPPPITNGLAGRHFILHSEHIGSLDVGAPVYYRRLQVGQVVSYELDKNGRGFTFNIFVNAPYHQYVRQSTLFAHASGIELNLDASGLKLQTESLASILSGGISFETPADTSAANQAAANTEFTLYASRARALQHPDLDVRQGVLYFTESVRGLQPGAPLDLRGIVIGEVKAIRLEHDARQKKWRVPVDVNLYPQRLRNAMRRSSTSEVASSEQLLRDLQQAGLYAQLKTGNLLTGAMYIALDVGERGKASSQGMSGNGVNAPILIATVPGGLDQLQTSVTSIANKIDKLPLTELGQDLRGALASLNTSLQSADKLLKRLDGELAPRTSATLEQVNHTLRGVDKVLAEDGNLQLDLRETLREIKRAASALQQFADSLERHPEALLQGKPKDQP